MLQLTGHFSEKILHLNLQPALRVAAQIMVCRLMLDGLSLAYLTECDRVFIYSSAVMSVAQK
jgi:hypothetical protein